MTDKPPQHPLFNAIRECLADKRISKNDAAVYTVLLSYARGATSRPSRKRIARDAGINYVNVSRHTRKLERFGYARAKRTRGRQTNVYELPHLTDMGITGDTCRMGVIPATVEVFTGDTPTGTDMGITGDTQSLRANNSGTAFPSRAERGQADAPPKRALDAGATEHESLKSSPVHKDEPMAAALKAEWNRRLLPNWAGWVVTSPKLNKAMPGALALVREAREEKEDVAAVVGFVQYLTEVDLFAGRKVKDDGQVFRLTPDYVLADLDRLSSILNRDYESYGKPRGGNGPTRKRKMLGDAPGWDGRAAQPMNDDDDDYLPDYLVGAI